VQARIAIPEVHCAQYNLIWGIGSSEHSLTNTFLLEGSNGNVDEASNHIPQSGKYHTVLQSNETWNLAVETIYFLFVSVNSITSERVHSNSEQPI
jgi:hypothetical protein